MPLRKPVALPVALFVCLSLSACRSAFVETSIVNHTGGTVQLIEVDYPNASFGTQQIASGAAYYYRFKILDSGPIKISFTAPNGKIYTATGPSVSLGQQGQLSITLDPGGKVEWSPALSESYK